MRIYRYTYIKKEIKVTEFECTKTYQDNYIICENCKLYKKTINKKFLDKMIDKANYIMWSLESNLTIHFKDLIIKRKLDIFNKKVEELEDLKNEIIELGGKLEND